MKKSTEPLQRLFRAAAAAAKEIPATPPRGLENRVIAQWRKAGAEDDFAPLMELFRRAAVLVGCILFLSMGWSWMQNKSESASEIALASYALDLQLPP
jgi:hypothetical protein